MNTSRIKRRLQQAAVLSIALLLTAVAAVAQETSDPRTISVSGEGTVRVEPDMATVHFGVVSVADDPEMARTANAEASSRAMNAVRNLGIEDRFIRLETLRLQPHREWVEDRRRYEERGYEAVRQVVVEVHDLEMLPELVAEIVAQGANRLDRVAYDLDDRGSARDDALRTAVINARAKASLVAETLEVELGRVLRVHEQNISYPQPVYRAESMVQMDAKAVPEPDAYAAGELEVRVDVQAVFEIE